LEPGKDIEIAFTGIRPGEKLSEDLWEEGKKFNPTQHPDIFQLEDNTNLTNGELSKTIDKLLSLSNKGDNVGIIKLADETIPGSSLAATPPPDLTSID
jgi:FlaA1/EpsC-like NDP-sugar epimerase